MEIRYFVTLTCDYESLRQHQRRQHSLGLLEFAEGMEHSGIAASVIRDYQRTAAVDDHGAVLFYTVEIMIFSMRILP